MAQAQVVENKEVDWDAVKKDILGILNQPGYDDDHAGPVLVRLAWHSSGTYDAKTDTGGSDGAGMRYEKEGGDPANAGLQHARVFLEPIKKKYPEVTYADLWIFAGCVAIEAMGGPKIPFKPGRTDFPDDSKVPPRGRLPDAAQAADHLREVFGRMGFNAQETVALAGAHSLGRCHSDRSGFHGAWTMQPTKFSNTFFKMLLQLNWEKKDWTGPFQYKSEELGEELMLLPTDWALKEDPEYSPWVKKYAEDRDLFFDDFSKAFAKLIELGVHRDRRPQKAAPKKDDKLGAPGHGDGLGKAKL